MSYRPENFDTIDLNLLGKHYRPEPTLDIVLDFTLAVGLVPLPWVRPTVTRTWAAPINRANSADFAILGPLGTAIVRDHSARASFEQAIPAPLEISARFNESKVADHESGQVWDYGQPTQQNLLIPYRESNAHDRVQTAQWQPGTVKDNRGFKASFLVVSAYTDILQAITYFHVDQFGNLYDDSIALQRIINADRGPLLLSLATFGEPYTPTEWNAVALNFGWEKPKRPIVPHDQATELTARQATPRDSRWRLPWGAGDTSWRNWNLTYPVEENEQEPNDPAPVPTIRTVYLTMNTLQIIDLATSTPLDINGVSIGLDIDSLAWKFSGNLFGEGTLALVQPDANGMKDISVRINGHQWIFAIDRYTSDERFPTKKFKISGTSRTQYMAAPFAPIGTATNTAATTAAQAANKALENTGFSLDWSTTGDDALPDWPIPIGALRYQDKTPAQVVAQIVTAAGGVLIPDQAQDKWKVQPRYKVAPWHWDTAAPDANVYAGMIRSRSGKYEPGQEFNACFVSGVEQGVSVEVQRTGSGGTNPMPDIFDDLITDTQPAIARGRNELAATGNKVIETLSIIIPESQAVPGVLLPGQLLKVLHNDAQQDYIGLVLSNSISVAQSGGAAVYQNVTIERNA
ncbi:hypothetical protein BGP77_11600 [Saccharospirillum sp. MSK14-1]|uniref:hypothetical protein n=1 Tax=Saccharospirillum sp. MSK14-1 TaxID=1897632 RepID=UPI000D3A9C27|nr:hypothetical protein [Saccharospirillum sp. MSK14-1]PTY38583.1 hypothetical protein BGP77_11600 [Saccharospirillum sp. MSK14-1]